MGVVVLIIAIIAVLILGHEWGHFIVARRHGMRVEEFGIGFPPRLFTWRRGETMYSINLIPLGGFVRLYGEDGSGRDDRSSFSNHSAFARAQVLIAGVAMNLVLAFLFLTAAHGIGVPSPFDGAVPANMQRPQLQILGVADGSPAEEAGIKAGDVVVRLAQGERVFDVAGSIAQEDLVPRFQEFIFAAAGTEITMQLTRGEGELEVMLKPRLDPPPDEGATGILISKVGFLSSPWYLAWWEGARSTYDLTKTFLVAFGGIIKKAVTTGQVTEQLTGPIGIVSFTAQASELGAVYLLQLIAILSINLAILNALPFPALDGGRVLFLLIEKLKGSPVSRKVEQWAHVAGFALLILLMIFVTVRDINRFF